MKKKKLLKNLIVEAKNKSILPLNFRTTKIGLPANPHFNIKGLNELKLIGSAQFSEKQLVLAQKLIGAPIVIFDLRKEPHGYIDGVAVVPAVKSLKVLHDLDTEEHIVDKHDLVHHSIPIVDGDAATWDQIKEFCQIVRRLDDKTWIWVHCAHGHGRTTTFMTVVDILHNWRTTSLSDIISRQNMIGGINLFDIPVPANKDFDEDAKRKELLIVVYDEVAHGRL